MYIPHKYKFQNSFSIFKILFLSHPCCPPHPSQPHTGPLQEHWLFSRQLSPRLRQLTLVGISVKNISRLRRLQSTLARVVTWTGTYQHLQDFAGAPFDFLSGGTYTIMSPLWGTTSWSPVNQHTLDPHHEQDFATCAKICSRRLATRTVFIPYEIWITRVSWCRTGNMELPAVWH